MLRSTEFWEKAIENYSTNNDFRNVFVSITSDRLPKVYEKAIEDLKLNGYCEDLKTPESIKRNFDISLLNLFIEGNFDLFPFLTFCSFSMSVYESKEGISDFWQPYLTFLRSKGIGQEHLEWVANAPMRGGRVSSVVGKLKEKCTSKGKEFIDKKVYKYKHVGLILTHSIFNGSTISKIKEAIYRLGMDDDLNFDNWDSEDYIAVLESAELRRIKEMYTSGLRQRDGTNEVVEYCLQTWLQGWIPNEKDKEFKKAIRLAASQKPRKSSVLIKRFWYANQNSSKLIPKLGFVSTKIGSEGKLMLSEDLAHFIDLNDLINLENGKYIYFLNDGMFMLGPDSIRRILSEHSNIEKEVKYKLLYVFKLKWTFS